MLDKLKIDDGLKRIFIVLVILSAGCLGISDSKTATPTDEFITKVNSAGTIPEETSTATQPTTLVPVMTERPRSGSTATLADTVTPTLTPTPTPTPTAIPTQTPEPATDWGYFYGEFDNQMNANARFPIQLRGYDVYNDTFYVVVNATPPSVNEEKHAATWIFVANAFVAVVQNVVDGKIDHPLPEKMVVWDANTTEYEKTPGTFTVQTEWALAHANGTWTIHEYHDRVRNTSRPQTEREQRLAARLDEEMPNATYYRGNETESG